MKSFFQYLEGIIDVDSVYSKGRDIQYPDNIFQHISTSEESQVCVNFYKKITEIFNKIFNRKVECISKVGNDNFNVVIRWEQGLEPSYYAYPTAKIGQHTIQKHIDKTVPGTSLRHEFFHEAIVPFIMEKFERINNQDNSANLDNVDVVQRARAHNYTLEEIFYERLIEQLERFITKLLSFHSLLYLCIHVFYII